MPVPSRAARLPVAVVLAALFFACAIERPEASSLDVPVATDAAMPSTARTSGVSIEAGADGAATCDAGITARGDCTLACASGETQCGARCSDTTTDAANCGDCGQACGSLQVCYGGVCSAGCPAGTVVCAGKCVEPNADPKHCGATLGCGEDGGSPGKACTTSQACYGSQCLADCPNNATMCGGKCTDTTSDSANCGACGHRCATGNTCSSQICCPAGSVGCNGACANLQTDATSCGMCGARCAAGQTCSSGHCR